jgi:hypothetical protein
MIYDRIKNLSKKLFVVLPVLIIILSCNLPRNEKGELASPEKAADIIVRLLNVVLEPDITIETPGNGAKFEEGTTVEFQASLSDIYKKSEPNTVQWTSSLDGILGTGHILTVSDLSVGVHRIQAEVSNSEGKFGNSGLTRKDSIQIEIYEKAESLAIEACIVPTNGYDWSYEDKDTRIGTGGNAKGMPSCVANFVLRSNLNEDVHLLYYSVFDNDAMHSENWESRRMDAFSEWSDRVSHTGYVDGSVTYSEIQKILLLRNDPACFHYLDTNDERNEILWETMSTVIEKLPCP